MTGEILWFSESGEEGIDSYPEEVDTDLERYLPIPDKAAPGLTSRLALDFAESALSPSDVGRVYDIFGRRGACGRFKELPARRGRIGEWYRFEEDRMKRAIRDWAEFEGIAIDESKA